MISVAIAAIAGAAALIAVVASGASKSTVPDAPPTVLRLDFPRSAPVIPPGFLGLGIEYRSLANYAGGDPNEVDPVLETLIRNLTPGQSPVLRIGGDTTDWSWWPVPGMSKPPWVHYSLTPQWLAVTRELTQSLDARLILGINFEADSDVLARTEASALMRGVGPRSVVALELGNEPELYHSFGWYRGPNGQEVTGRPADYDFDMFEREFTSVASALRGVPVAGPTTGGPWWEPDWARFLAAEPSVKLATLHRYPLHACSRRSSPLYPTIDHLVAWPASAGLAASSERLVRVAHAHGVPLRIDEMNVTPCPQRAHEVRSFAGALWALDVLFEMRAAGVDGVNVQSTTGGTEDLFAFARLNGRWQGLVEPEYYGLLMFAQAAPPGSQLVSLSRSTRGSLHTWATRARDGTVRVVVINDGAAPRKVALRAPAARGSATLERLLAPSIASKQGITLGGQTFGSVTTTGRLAGHRKTDRVSLRAGRYVFSMPAYSAAMLTLG